MQTISFPPGWSSERLTSISPEEFGQLPEAERAVLKQAVRKHAFSPEYAQLQKLNQALSAAATRPATPPSYVPSGWTAEQAKALDMSRVEKLSEEEQRLWAAGRFADSIRQARQIGQWPKEPPSYIPVGWSTEQATAPTFEMLSRLPQHELTRYMQSYNEKTVSQIASVHTGQPGPSGDDVKSPSPLVQTLQRRGYPPWGFVIVRTYYASDERWQAFQERLDSMCDAQLDEETGEGLQSIKDALEFKMIEDPRLEGATHTEARKHFHTARAMGGVADGLDLAVLLLVDEDVVMSVLGDGPNLSSGSSSASPYLIAVDVTEPPADETSGSYPGFLRVSVDALLSELYPKLCMGLCARDLWAMLEDGKTVWTGDEA